MGGGGAENNFGGAFPPLAPPLAPPLYRLKIPDDGSNHKSRILDRTPVSLSHDDENPPFLGGI